MATLVASTAAYGSSAVQNFAVQKVCSSHTRRSGVLLTCLALLRHKGGGVDGHISDLLDCVLRVCLLLTEWMAYFLIASLRYGLVGLLRPLTVYPSEMVYWGVSRIWPVANLEFCS